MSSNRVIASGLEGRYAMALFSLAQEKKALDKVAKDLETLEEMTRKSEDFSEMIKNPVLDPETQKKAIGAISKKAKFHELTQQFLGILIENRRLRVLGRISREFARIVSAFKGEITAEVSSAQPLTKTQKDALAKKLKKSLGQDIAFDITVDENLLGGLVVKVGSRVIDNSLRTKLDNLTLAMKGV